MLSYTEACAALSCALLLKPRILMQDYILLHRPATAQCALKMTYYAHLEQNRTEQKSLCATNTGGQVEHIKWKS